MASLDRRGRTKSDKSSPWESRGSGVKDSQHRKSSRESPMARSLGEDSMKSSGAQVERDLEEDALSPLNKPLNQQLSTDGRGV